MEELGSNLSDLNRTVNLSLDIGDTGVPYQTCL